MNYSEWHQIAQQSGLNEINSATLLSSSIVSQSWQLTTTDGQQYWARTCLARHQAVIECEVENISALRQAGVSTTDIITQGKTNKAAWLVCRWQALLSSSPSMQQIKAELHRLHQQTPKRNAYGWTHANDINGLLQSNQWLSDWGSFYRSQRILPQLRKAKEKGLAQRHIDNLESLLAQDFDTLFENYQPTPCLVHGNLYLSPPKQTLDDAVFFYHPACYVGDAEVDQAAVLLAHHRDDLIKGEGSDLMLALSIETQLRLSWYQLYYALVEFNLMAQQDTRLIEALVDQTQRSHHLNG